MGCRRQWLDSPLRGDPGFDTVLVRGDFSDFTGRAPDLRSFTV
jgi:hypothetical protein